MSSSKQHAFLKRTSLRPGESLPSLLARFELLNYLDDQPSLFREICFEFTSATQHDIRRFDRPTKSDIYTRLSILTGISPTDLYLATIHRYADIVNPPGSTIASVAFPTNETKPLVHENSALRALRPQHRAAWCPQCLAESSYHRLLWTPLAVSACLHHHCLLIDKCPMCDSSISIRALIRAHCTQCNAKLSEISSEKLCESNSLGGRSQEVIQAWFNDIKIETEELYLPEASSHAMYHVLEGLRSSVANFTLDWEYWFDVSEHFMLADKKLVNSTKPEVVPAHMQYTTAFKALVNWPDGFFSFLRAYQLYKGGEPNRALFENFGNIYAYWFEKKMETSRI